MHESNGTQSNYHPLPHNVYWLAFLTYGSIAAPINIIGTPSAPKVKQSALYSIKCVRTSAERLDGISS
jgi:hypothetical protein